MPTVSQGAAQVVVIPAGQVYRVSTAGEAIIDRIAGLPDPGYSSDRILGDEVRRYGPLEFDARINVRAIAGTATYEQVQVAGPVHVDESNVIRGPDGRSIVDLSSSTTLVAASRGLTAEDDGKVLECAADGIVLTVPTGLPAGFRCDVIPDGTTEVAPAEGVTLNGGTAALDRDAEDNPLVTIVARASAADSYVVTGVDPED